MAILMCRMCRVHMCATSILIKSSHLHQLSSYNMNHHTQTYPPVKTSRPSIRFAFHPKQRTATSTGNRNGSIPKLGRSLRSRDKNLGGAESHNWTLCKIEIDISQGLCNGIRTYSSICFFFLLLLLFILMIAMFLFLLLLILIHILLLLFFVLFFLNFCFFCFFSFFVFCFFCFFFFFVFFCFF